MTWAQNAFLEFPHVSYKSYTLVVQLELLDSSVSSGHEFKNILITTCSIVVSASWWKARFKTNVTDSTLWQNCDVIQNYLVYL